MSLNRRLAGADPSVALVSTMLLVLAFWLQPDCNGTFASSAWRAQCGNYYSLVESGCWFGTIASEPGSAGDLMAQGECRVVFPAAAISCQDSSTWAAVGVTSFMLTVAKPDGEKMPDVFVMDTREQKWDGGTGLSCWVNGMGSVWPLQSHAFR